MPLYYAELKTMNSFVPSKTFRSDDDAIKFFRSEYGDDDIEAVIKDEDPKLTLVYENHDRSLTTK